jgi:hypothetical protein
MLQRVVPKGKGHYIASNDTIKAGN